ncbi:MAG: hypothetical protein ACPLZY_02865, partial [Candidatus Norongarragalinales archaeon]
AVGGLALIIALAVWMIWRSIAPAAPGIGLGYYEVVGRHGGQKLIKRIKGTLVDATALFLSPEIESAFLQILKEDIKEMLTRTNDADLSSLSKALEKADIRLADYVRIVVTREKLFTKHVIVQYGYVNNPLNAYAAYDPQAKFTLGFGFLTQGVITGKMHTLPQPWQLYKLGKVQVHLFKPDPLKEDNEKTAPEWLAKLSLYAPATVELKQVLKAKDEELKEKERELLKVGKERAANATKVDGLLTAIQGFTTKLTPEGLEGKKFALGDFVTVAFPTVVGYLIAEAAGMSPLAGTVVGMFLGGYIVFRK